MSDQMLAVGDVVSVPSRFAKEHSGGPSFSMRGTVLEIKAGGSIFDNFPVDGLDEVVVLVRLNLGADIDERFVSVPGSSITKRSHQ